ncbi:MAG: hypothetical protein QF654_10025 [Alphaproteobacteria bacterium]|jgi:hypothetical protein|nr:hypothetical protein [Alphaproteobacteria bacterium]|tara:strand:- start:25 stop:456 length:432 start_codon:yes stop_codon:yes gene_type:complete
MTTSVIRKTAIATAIGFAFAAIAAISPASAGGKHHGHKGSGYKQEQTYKRGHNATRNQPGRQLTRIISHLIGGAYYNNRPNRHNRWRRGQRVRHYRQVRRCHSVYSYKTDRWGNQVKVVGTMCYDRRGNGYIVRGSRHVVERY